MTDKAGDDPLNRAGRRALEQERRRTARKAAMSGGAVLTIGSSLVAPASPAAALDATVTTTDDTIADDGETSLREALAQADDGDTIDFDSGLAAGTITLDSTLGQLVVEDSITIDGPTGGITIDAADNSRVFYLYDEIGSPIDVAMNDLTITGGYDTQGGGIIGFNVDLTLTNVTVSSNRAVGNGGGILLFGDPDTDSRATADITGSTITGNEAGTYDVGATEDGDGAGGGIAVKYGDVSLTNSFVTSNTADDGGGGIAVISYGKYGGDITVVGGGVTANRALNSPGGGIMTAPLTTVLLQDTDLSGNESAFSAGEGYADPYSNFMGGGGLAAQFSYVEVSGTTVDDNTVGQGSVYIAPDPYEVYGDTVYFRGDGGALLVFGALDVDDSEFAYNYASGGGGAVSFEGKYGGGGPALQADVGAAALGGVQITGTTFFRNEAKYDGGALLLDNIASESLIDASSFIENYANSTGGAIQLDEAGASLTIQRSTFDDNVADGDGGAIWAGFNEGGSLTVDSSTFYDNYSFEDGGAVFIDDGYDQTLIVNSTFSGNEASDNGGALAVDDDAYDVRISHSTIVDNEAYIGGGIGLYDSGYDESSVIVDHTIVANNFAKYFGDDIGIESDIQYADVENPNVTVDWSLVETPIEGDHDFAGSNNLPEGTDPQLGLLTDNGGPTETRSPLPGSPVIDAGDPGFSPPPSDDQRGFDRVSGGRIDIGAVEVQVAPPPPAVGTIQFQVAAVTVPEAGGPATITVVRTGDSSGAASVRVQSAEGTANSPEDFGAIDQVLNFGPGVTQVQFQVPIVNDVVGESPDEQFTLTLSNPTGATVGTPSTETVTIDDDDRAVCVGFPSVANPPFTDVPGENVHNASIACLFYLDIADGTTASTYNPGGNVSRAQMASFVARAIERTGGTLPAAPPDAFTDDEAATQHELRINQLAAVGVVSGTGPGTYNPSGNITRGQMAAFLVRAYEFVTGDTTTPTGDHFTDDEGSVFEDDINVGFELGLFVGQGSTFDPNSPVRRDQMATFLVRLLNALDVAGHPTTPPAAP